MKTFSLYVDRRSFVHDIDPFSKLSFIAFAILLPIIAPDMRVSFVCVAAGFLLLASAGVLKRAAPVYAFVSFVLLTVVIIQGMFGVDNETPVFNVLGFTFYREGLLTALKVILRVYNIIQSFLILVLTTKPEELVGDLVWRGLSPRIGYVINSTFQIIPQMMATVGAITDAQRSRGMETEGNLIVRFKAFIPLMGPVVLNSFISTKERAMALEVRAFSAKNGHTAFHERKSYKYGMLLRSAFVVILMLTIFWRLFA